MITPILQFGTSRFLQAHADLFIHEAAEGGEDAGPIAIVASSGSALGRARLAAFDDPSGFPVIIRGLEDGRAIEREIRVRSVRRGLDAEADWRELTRLFVEQARFVISNTTESGFAVPPDLTLDLASPISSAPPSYPAKLLALLAARFAAGSYTPLTILPTELLGRNGDALKRAVTDLARRSRAPDALLRFIEGRCIFANTLVDRIVSGALEPAGAIAEPYALWAVEAQAGLVMPCSHPAIRIVADLEPFERLKLHILNLGHTVLADIWLRGGLAPDATVRAMLATPVVRDALTEVYDDEVLPGFAARNIAAEASAYRATTVERFANPFLDHRLSDIANGHTQKVARRIGGFLHWAAEAGWTSAPRLRAIAEKSAPG